jgi:lantibiotic transport system ATP-binding protein
MYCVETKGITFRFFKNEKVLDNVNLQVPYRSIYGFLGPNGAGKTTTIRLILGLLKKQEGEISIFNKPFTEYRQEILQKTGTLVESPSLYSQLTAYENLLVYQKIYHCPKERIDQVLEIVGLPDTKKKKTGKFSFGMKQRLAIAISLLHEPSLLILDEPTNGLDPNGIMEIRELLRRLNTECHTTVLISSHLLAEIEKLATHVGIINKGKILFQGTLEELQHKQNLSSAVSFSTDNLTRTSEILSSNKLYPLVSGKDVIVGNISREMIARINKELVNNNIEVYQISMLKNDLESIFMDLTKN